MEKLLELIKKLLGMSGSSDSSSSSESSEKGFTLIELLIVIAVIGVLASAVLIAIDPIEQLKRGRDSGRKQSVTQMGRALQSYYTSRGSYPTAAQWSAATNILVTSGELKVFPTNPGGTVTTPTCASGGNAGVVFCYKPNGTSDFIVYTPLESESEFNKCTPIGTAANTFYIYVSSQGKAGTNCSGEPAPTFSTPLY